MKESQVDQAEQGKVQSRGKKWWLKRLLLVGGGLMVVLLGLGYAARTWLVGETQKMVIAELAKQGVHLGIESSRRVPLRGMVFKNLAVYGSAKKETPLLVISDVALFPSLGRWILERRISARITLVDSEIRMLVDGKEVEKLKGVNAEIKAWLRGITVKRLNATMNGVDYDLSGEVQFGKKKGQRAGDEVIKLVDDVKKGPLLDFTFWQGLREWIEVESKGGQVKIAGSFDVDTRNLQAMSAQVQFSGKSFSWHGLDFEHFRTQVDYRAKDKQINVKDLDVLSKEGKMAGDFSYQFASKVLQVGGLDGQANILSLINGYMGKAVVNEGVFVMVKAPHIGVSGALDFSDLKKSDMKVEFLPVDEVEVKVAGELISMKELTGAVVFEGGKVSVVQPDVFAKVNEGEFHLGGYLQLLSEDSGQGNQMSADFTLAGKSIAWHGLVLDHAKSKVIYSGQNELVVFEGLDVGYRAKSLSGELRYKIVDRTVEMVKMESQINFVELIKDLLTKQEAEKMPDVVLVKAPHLQVDGLVDFGDLAKSNVKVKFLDEKDVVVKTGGSRIEMKGLKGGFAFASGTVNTVDPGLAMKMADGDVSLNAKMDVLSDSKAYHAAIKLENLSLAELKALVNSKGDVEAANKEMVKGAEEVLQKESEAEVGKGGKDKKVATKEMGKEQKEVAKAEGAKQKTAEQKKKESETALQGRLFFEFDGSGDVGAMVRKGKGKMRIEEAEFYAMPILGSFFGAMNKLIPAFGRRKDGEMHGTQRLTATYQINDAKIRSEDMRIQGNLSRVEVKVFYDVTKDLADIDGKIELTGAVGAVTNLASNLLEIEGTGPIKNLKWGLKNLNGNGLVKGVGGTGGEVIKVGGSAVLGAAEMTGKGAIKVIEEGGEVGQVLKNVIPFSKDKKNKKRGMIKPTAEVKAQQSGESAVSKNEEMKADEVEGLSKGLKKILPFGKKKKKSD